MTADARRRVTPTELRRLLRSRRPHQLRSWPVSAHPRGIMATMPITQIFSKRGVPVPAKDVLVYEPLPEPFRIQVIHIWTTTLGRAQDHDPYGFHPPLSFSAWQYVASTLARELGMVRISKSDNPFGQAGDFLLNQQRPIKQQLDLIQLSFQVIDQHLRENYWEFEQRGHATQTPDDAIEELNHRFLEHGLGYEYAHRQIVRLDSTYQHAEVIKPALTIINNKTFRNAQTEFLDAHEHYRHGRYEESINEALKSFETTMKIICHEKGWKYNEADQAKTLIKIVLTNGLVSPSFQTQFHGLAQLLESGTPTTRNKMGGHGMGVQTRVVPSYMAAYALQTAAANITLMVSAFEDRS